MERDVRVGEEERVFVAGMTEEEEDDDDEEEEE